MNNVPINTSKRQQHSSMLPKLPSARAKELDRRLFSNNDTNNDYKNDNQVESTSSSQEEKSNAPEIESKQIVPPLHISPSKEPSNIPYQSEADRSEQLNTIIEKEKQAFGGLPPLDSNVACNAIHQYISTTSSFLNSYIANVSAATDGIDHKLTVLERQMNILESTISSISGLFPEEDESDIGGSSVGDNEAKDIDNSIAEEEPKSEKVDHDE